MTQHEITVEKTVEEQETVYSCNSCGLEVKEREAEVYTNGTKEIHLHSKCEPDLLHTSQPEPDSAGWSLPSLEVGDTVRMYLMAVKYILLFVFLPVTFVKVSTIIEEKNNARKGEAMVILGIVWVWLAAMSGTILL